MLVADTDVVLVLTTLAAGDGSEDAARAFARVLVDERLAACVTIGAPMTSVYRWKGTVEVEAERPLTIKTTRGRLPALEARMRALHPYEVPELLVLSVDGGGAAYLRWVGENV
jgi:periplasmic divalent cation tolerance protein